MWTILLIFLCIWINEAMKPIYKRMFYAICGHASLIWRVQDDEDDPKWHIWIRKLLKRKWLEDYRLGFNGNGFAVWNKHHKQSLLGSHGENWYVKTLIDNKYLY